jgi:hypothetical protein
VTLKNGSVQGGVFSGSWEKFLKREVLLKKFLAFFRDSGNRQTEKILRISKLGWKIASNTKCLGEFFSIRTAKRNDQPNHLEIHRREETNRNDV